MSNQVSALDGFLCDLGLYIENVILLRDDVVKNHFRPEVSKVSTIYPEDLVQMMKKCWDPVPDNRPSFEGQRGVVRA